MLPSFLPTVKRDVNTINPRPKPQASVRIPALLWLEAWGPRGRSHCLGSGGLEGRGWGGGQGEFLPSLADLPLAGVLISGARGETPSKASPEIGYVFCEFSAKVGAEGHLHWPPTGLFHSPPVPPPLLGADLTCPGSRAVQTLALCPLCSETSRHSEVFSDRRIL